MPITFNNDIVDRAARLLGVVYGSQAQQLLQRATTFDLLTQLRHAGAEIDPRAIRKLTSADVINLSDKWARQLGLVDISRVLGAALSATNPVIVRLTDGTAVTTSPIKAQLPDALTAAGHLKQSIEEQAIALGIDVQARYPLRTLRTIATPTIDTDYFLPETGSIDLSNFIHSTWFAYAPATASMVISACELQISLDGGTTFRKAAGYEIADANFVRDEWNNIDVPLMLAQARFRIRFGTAAPASAELAVIRKA